MIDLTDINAKLENRDLTIKALNNDFYQLYDVNDELRLHVQGWDAFCQALAIDQGTVVMDELGILPYEPIPTPEEVFDDIYDQKIEWVGDQWVFSFYDEGAIFAASSWSRFYEMLVEYLGVAYFTENMLRNKP